MRGEVSVWTQSGVCTDSFNHTRGDRDTLLVACHKINDTSRQHQAAVSMASAAPEHQRWSNSNRSAAAAAAAAAAAQVVPHCSMAGCASYTIVEAENFTVRGSSTTRGVQPRANVWVPQAWGHDPNLFASDVSNVFHSRRAYLHAGESAVSGSEAVAVVPVPQDGEFHVRHSVGRKGGHLLVLSSF